MSGGGLLYQTQNLFKAEYGADRYFVSACNN
jgi:hypothetical protein